MRFITAVSSLILIFHHFLSENNKDSVFLISTVQAVY